MTPEMEVLVTVNKRRTILGTALLVAVLGSVLGFVLLFKLKEAVGNLPIFFVLGAWLPYYLTLAFIWKCPSCNKHIGNRPTARSCPNCGTAFFAADEG